MFAQRKQGCRTPDDRRLIARYFGSDFALDRVRSVLGFLAAAAVGVATSSLGAAVTSRLALGPPIIGMTAAEYWFASVFVGIIAVAPLVIEVAGAVWRAPPRSDFIEGALALMALAAVTAVTILVPRGTWETPLPDSDLALACRRYATDVRGNRRVPGFHHDR